MGIRPWIVLSTSSGETFKALYSALAPEFRVRLKGAFFDRESSGVKVLSDLVGQAKVKVLSKAELENAVLDFAKNNPETLILLCGYFSIISANFIDGVGLPIVNTHPSLLPSFAGLDKKVHKEVHEKVPIGGFTVHLVTSELDGGPILFQHPVFLPLGENEQQHRARVRSGEQKWLPKVLETLLCSKISSEDRHLSSSLVRNKYCLSIESFVEKNL